MRVTANSLERQRRPRLAVIGGLVRVRLHVAISVTIEGGISSAFVVAAGFNPRHPRVLSYALHLINDVVPRLAGVARDLHVPIVSSNPDQWRIFSRLADAISRCVHLAGRGSNGDSARFVLLLLL